MCRRIRVLAATVGVVACLQLHPPAASAGVPGPGHLSRTNASALEPGYEQIIQDEAYWISLAQIPQGRGAASGGLAWYPYGSSDLAQIRPYIGNRAAVGMLAAGSYYHPMVKAWLDWYFAHLNRPDYNGVHGTVYDYDANPSTGVEAFVANQQGQSPSYDSTDAYAATFLTLLRAYAEANPGDGAYLAGKAADIELIATAAVATQQPDGLTWARPDYQAKYLMDNVEVEQGLRDYAWLLRNVLNDAVGANDWAATAATVRQGIKARLWSPCGGSMYCWASDQLHPTWSVWYPDSVAQMWPVNSGVAASSRAASLYGNLNQAWPDWTTTGNNPDGHPWAILCYTAALRADKARVDACLNGSGTNWAARGRPWPWTTANAADRARAAKLAMSLP